MRQLHICTAQPDDTVFAWQTRVQLTNFRKYGYSALARILVFIPSDRVSKGINPLWLQLEKDFPETGFFFYPDTTDILNRFIKGFQYIPLLRPHILQQHFQQYPFLSEEAILYIDSDVIFTKPLDFTPFLEDDICYLSDTKSYISASYFDSKVKDVRPDRLDAYKNIDVLSKCLEMFGLTREIAEENENSSGGAQYLLKNIDSKFWKDVFDGCLFLRMSLLNINERFFPGSTPQERENKGFQRWCADMWSVLWNLWKRDQKTLTPKEMDFAWATDSIQKWDKVHLYHDAGAGSNPLLFDKRNPKYIIGNNVTTPFEDDLSFVSNEFCSYNYVQQILESKP